MQKLMLGGIFFLGNVSVAHRKESRKTNATKGKTGGLGDGIQMSQWKPGVMGGFGLERKHFPVQEGCIRFLLLLNTCSSFKAPLFRILWFCRSDG